MQFLRTYLNKIKDRGNYDLAESISKTADEVGDKYLRTFSFKSHEIGLLFGNVQSGKTGQMFGILCKAADLGFPVFLLLTADNIVLQQQTAERVKSDLDGFCVCGENDSRLFEDNSLMQPAIIVLKKNARILKLWANTFNATGFMKGNPLFIIDDEADAASLNTLVNQNRQSSINKYLDSIKNGASSSLYLQVTGTPQSIFLQTYSSGWHPYFTYYFQPGKGYLGGDFFFPQTGRPDCVSFIDTLKNPARSAVVRHLAVSAQIIASGGKVSNCIVHPSVRKKSHAVYSNEIKDELQWCLDNLTGGFKKQLKEEYDQLAPVKYAKLPFEKVYDQAVKFLTEKSVKVLILNSDHDTENSEYSEGCNFIIGGNTLGRGITFPNLQTVYYTRSSRNPQADTMWQHSRMFGYDRDPGMMMVYIDEYLYKLFSDINASNNSIIAQAEQGIYDVKLHYPRSLKPSRSNVIDKRQIVMISGGTNYFPFDPDNNTAEEISLLLSDFSENEPYYQVSMRLFKTLLQHVVPSADFNLEAFISAIDAMLAENPVSQGILIVRRGRNVSQGTGALLSSNDWQLCCSFENKAVLVMYQIIGNTGWKTTPIWVPNIKLPDNEIYYDFIKNVSSDDASELL